MSGPANWHELYDQDPAIIYALDDKLKLLRCNPAWDRFALENGAPNLTGAKIAGTCIMDVVPGVLRDFYLDAYNFVRSHRARLKSHRAGWLHIFECSSAEAMRSFQMRLLPGETDGFLVVNTLLREEPHREQIHSRIDEYTDADGIVTMCAHCRRAEHLSQPGRWDFVPLLLALSGTLVKPGLCPFCFRYHYPESQSADARITRPRSPD